AEQRLTNAHGVCTTTVVDGLSRTVTQQRDHIDDNEPTRAFEILATDYDAFGRQLIETQTDYLPDYALDNASMLQPLCLTRRFAYDEWGNLSRTTEPDGVEVHEQTNPLGHARHEGPVQRTWRQTAGADRLISGLRETWFTPFDEPEHILRFDADGRELARQVFSYDGLGNLRTQVNEQGDATHHHYDAWNRLTSTERPDRAKVDRRYAAHSSSEVATRISVTPATSASPIILGEQVLDGLERPVELKVGKQRETLAYSDGSTLPASRRTAAGDEVRYHYAPNLTQAPVRTEIDDDVSDFDFHPRSARLIHASNHEGSQRYEYDVNNRLSARHWINEDGTTYSIAQATSLQGRQTSQTLASGLEKRTEYDEFGRPSLTRQGDLQAAFAYDRLGRPRSTVTQDLVGQTTLTTTIDYDDQDREILRTFEHVGQPTQTLEQGWGLDGLLASRHLRQGSTSLLEETFTYDKLGQLTQHTCAGTQLPKDRQGREILGQHFTYGAFHNIERCETRFSDTSTETLRFTYENDDPCQLTAVSFDPPAARPAVALVHDANGNLLNDHLGFQMRYDKRSRLLSVNAPDGRLLCEYRYDAHGQLHALGHADGTQTRLVFQDNRLSVAIRDALQTSILYDQDRPLGQQQSGGADATLLLRCNASQSVIAESQGQNLRQASYGAYGERTDAHPLKCLLGYNGEFVDPDTGWYLLGQGYRAYNPGLMRFQGPDALSPFEAGGLNRYAYVAGNPIGLRDPTGRYFQLSQTPENYAAMGAGRSMLGAIFSFILGAIMTVVATVATVLTAGAAAPSIGAAVGFIATASAASGTLVSVAGASAGLVSTVSQGIGMFANNPLALKIAEYSGYVSMLSVLNPGLVTKSVAQWMRVAANPANSPALPRMLQAGIQGLMQRAPGTAAAAGSSSFVARAATTLAGASTAPTTPRRAIRPGNSSTPIANSRVTSQASARAEEPVASSMRVRE
ncbi:MULTISPECIES: RHS repeat-associated core domain-containing protein, partial [unclassified Pseudomonas]|uniref:RHS repeat-associated core domain-containing protein n=1 Tax=unclassified Pseudomonas TaxID=196821 RepID=UPI00244D14E4